ncbi:MAG: glycosyltransferase [Qingshengfaniella sp.]
MIFVTVGTQLPFPRLIDAMNALAPGLNEQVFAQAGPEADPDLWPALTLRPHLNPAEFEQLFAEARVVVAHAGIGSILSAKRLGRPLIIMPRRHSLNEHRNDHQVATARQVQSLPGIHVAWQPEDLAPLLTDPALTPASPSRSPSHDALITRLRGFINGDTQHG